MRRFLTGLLWLAGLLALTACAGTPTTEPADTRALAVEIAALGPDVDPAEAARAPRSPPPTHCNSPPNGK